MKNKLSKFSNTELLEELASRDNNIVGSYSGACINRPSNFIEVSLESIYEITTGDKELTEEFFDKHFSEVYYSVDWGDVQLRVLMHITNFIGLKLKDKYIESNL